MQCSSHFSHARTHVTNCSPNHAQQSQIPSVLVFPSHYFVTLAFPYILPVPPKSVVLTHTAIHCYQNSTNHVLPVHSDLRCSVVSCSIPTFWDQLSLPSSRVKQSEMRPQDCLETSVFTNQGCATFPNSDDKFTPRRKLILKHSTAVHVSCAVN